MSDSSEASHRPRSRSAVEAELRTALGEGNPRKVRALIEAGANVRYEREHGYDALIDAVHGRDDAQLLDLLALLVSHGVHLSGVSSYGESGLRVLSRLGRFDAVRLLLAAGADKSQLGWTPLIEAVALGSLADVQAVLAQGDGLDGVDWWERTGWIVALLIGDIDKATLLRERGADTAKCGRCGRPPLFYAIQGHHPDVVRWLLREGAGVEQTDEFGTTALIEAVEHDDLECVEILFSAGANVEVNANGTALSRATSRAIIMRLLAAGADPADANQWIMIGRPSVDDDALAVVSPRDFQRAFTRFFGNANPELMRVPFWEAMIIVDPENWTTE